MPSSPTSASGQPGRQTSKLVLAIVFWLGVFLALSAGLSSIFRRFETGLPASAGYGFALAFLFTWVSVSGPRIRRGEPRPRVFLRTLPIPIVVLLVMIGTSWLLGS